MRGQAWRLKRNDAVRLGRVRHRQELEVCEAEDFVWVRTADPPEELQRELAALPVMHFTVLDDRQLIERGRAVPRGYLPQAEWLPLADWMEVDLDVPAYGATPSQVPVRTVRSRHVEEATVLLARFADWHSYAASAPQVRLDRLAFAVSDSGWTAIRGRPLPPIRGVRFVEHSGVGIQAGWRWQPAVAAEVLASAMRIARGDVALIHADGRWDHLSECDFVQASRAAVRCSAEEVDCGR